MCKLDNIRCSKVVLTAQTGILFVPKSPRVAYLILSQPYAEVADRQRPGTLR